MGKLIINYKGEFDRDYVENDGVMPLSVKAPPIKPTTWHYLCSDPMYIIDSCHMYNTSKTARYNVFDPNDENYYYEGIMHGIPGTNELMVNINDVVSNWVTHNNFDITRNGAFDNNNIIRNIGFNYIEDYNDAPLKSIKTFIICDGYSDKQFEATKSYTFNREFLLQRTDYPYAFSHAREITKNSKVILFLRGYSVVNVIAYDKNKNRLGHYKLADECGLYYVNNVQNILSTINNPNVAYFFITEEITSDDELVYGYMFKINEDLKPRYILYYVTPEGSIDYIYSNPTSKIESKFINVDYKHETWRYVDGTVVDSTAYFENKRFQSTSEDTFIFNTYFLKDKLETELQYYEIRCDYDRIKNAVNSTYAWIYDTEANLYYSVLPVDTSLPEKRNKYDKRISYQLKFKKSKDFSRR